ncbi:MULTISPECIES: ChrR family anti-sigma-E factor [Pseudoalteromonas]|uniref:Transcriptional regulator n=1 Tax=Pseudoalteromonas ruthenica TaxID=151081 RepID=A0A0F4PKV5_9GAMM|nr:MULTISPECIES: ChrR family anti-sigma-E factor [Pseudoalteromonas]KJY95618.1 transcriptional regulator [Pseudoalteromonas ruthenica]KJZ00494.1 transcriptional regulator [Pseudoalteromonas ruthenica]MCF2860652.1 ChrR family anti-sigma-E factor [Pseudoalteromonas sp. CNAT2-18]MCG7556521.1 ChrR family anti-sigma-E factor [Pseudoalteromonas sp. CNAT2-18.1]MCG7565637.1 ChrR family anti-sigma-E factor [Pseudoalteromonas sp. CnMc7-15]|tara:strand:+ start:6589 stop:7260 length:672 start_codon:yes stop_codon:yes gene_type:complete
MIKFHPNTQLLEQHVLGALPASLSVAISAHLELCDDCCDTVAALEQRIGEQTFTDDAGEELTGSQELLDAQMSAMLSDITADTDVDDFAIQSAKQISVGDRNITLPRALSHVGMSRFVQAGKLARSRLELDEGSIRTSLLYIAPGGTIPEHTHTGFELTLLLDGTFTDEEGEYQPGDFIWLDHKHDHTPYTEQGCLCLAVVNSALHFNKGLSKLLNPIGELIY